MGCDGGALRGPLPGPQKMKTPRLAPGGVGRGCFISCRALCGALWDVLERGNIRTLTDIKTALRACKWPLRRFCFFASPLPRWTRAQKCRLRAIRGRTSGGAWAGSVGIWRTQKTRPMMAQGGRWWYSRFFRCLPDHHKREQQNKQNNQAGVTSSTISKETPSINRVVPCPGRKATRRPFHSGCLPS